MNLRSLGFKNSLCGNQTWSQFSGKNLELAPLTPQLIHVHHSKILLQQKDKAKPN